MCISWAKKKDFGKLPIISFYRVVTVSIAAIRFSMAVESSCQAQVSQHPAANMSIASMNSVYCMNNATRSLLVPEDQTDDQSTQYKLDSAIIGRYFSNANHPPDTNRNLTQQNMNSIFRDLIISDRSGLALVQNLVNREPSPYPLAPAVNVANVVSNLEGAIIHSYTTYSSGSVKYLPTDRYTEKVASVTYMAIRSRNVTTPVDPYVEQSTSSIYDPFLWWQIFVGVGYNSYQLYFNQQYAVNFKNFLIPYFNGAAIFNNIMIGAAGEDSIWELPTRLIEDWASDLLETTSSTSVANNVNTFFNNQWKMEWLYDVSYTLGNHIRGTSEYAVWRPIIGGSTKLFDGFELTPSAGSPNYDVIAFNDSANEYGENTWVYFNVPPSWTAFFGYEGS